MSYRKYYILFIFIINFCFIGEAQDKFVLTSINKSNVNQVKIKWYSKAFIYPEGINIYKKESAEIIWTKLNTSPIKKDGYKPNAEELKQDKELKDYIQLINSISKLEGVPMLGAYVKSFKSEAFSKYLGIEYIDNTSAPGITVQYKVCVLNNGIETELGISNPTITGAPTEILPPKNIDIAAKNKKAVIKWLPETSRYYGVNIYRMFDSTGSDRIKINKDPIIVSKTKNKSGNYDYPEQFFIEEKLKEDTVYYFSFKVLDFFGEESEYSIPLKVFIKDLNAPLPPTFTGKQIKQKSVTLKWHKTDFEKDFTGYNIYKAHRSEKNYTRVNTKLLTQADSSFTDNVNKYGPYRYVIASIDRSGNEGVTNEIAIETIDEEPPHAPKGLTIIADTGKIVLSWQKNAEMDLWGYMVFQTINKNTSNDSYVLITPEPLRTNQFKQELAKNSKNKFLYKVLAIDSSYNKSTLSEFAVITLPDVVAPSEPFINNCYLDDKKNIVIEFFKNTELDLKGYDFYRIYKQGDAEITEKVNSKIIDNASSSFIDREFSDFGSLKYYMTATDSTNNVSKKSNIVKLNIRKGEDIVKHEIKSFDTKPIKDTDSWKLKWDINKEEDVFYVVYTKYEGDENFEPQTENLTETKYVLNLKSSAKVFVQVRAYTTKGLAAKSEIKLLENIKQ